MYRIALIPVVFVLLLGTASADPGDPIPLFLAVERSEVKVDVVQTGGYGRVMLKIRNCMPERRRVRFPGTYLRPRGGRHQRLALGYSQRTKAPTVTVPASGTWKGWVTSCCMDSGKSSPGTRTAYSIVKRQAPKRITSIMEHWAVNPALAQSLINDYVWGRKTGTPPGNPAPPPTLETFFKAEGARLLVWGERVMVLTGGGELLRLRDDNRWECLGTGVSAAGVGWGRIFARFGGADMKEYNETEKKWAPRGTLNGAETILPGPKEAYVVMRRTLYRYIVEKRIWAPVRRGVAGACLSLDLNGSFVYVAGTPSVGSFIRRSSGKAITWASSRHKGFKDVFATASTLYGLTPRGLIRITEEGYKKIQGKGVYFPHRTGLFRLDAAGHVEEYTEADRFWRRRGSPGYVICMAIDPVTGTLVALRPVGKIKTLSRGEAWKDLSSLPRIKDVLNLKQGK